MALAITRTEMPARDLRTAAARTADATADAGARAEDDLSPLAQMFGRAAIRAVDDLGLS